MELFQLWLVINSCIFMTLYFMTFLPLKYSRAGCIAFCAATAAISILLEIVRIRFGFYEPWPKIASSAIQIPVLQAGALILSRENKIYALFIGFSSSNFVLGGNIISCAVLLAFHSITAAMAVCTLANAAIFACMNRYIKHICLTLLSREISVWMCIIPAMCYTTFFLMLYFPVSFDQRPDIMLAACSLLATVVIIYILFIQYISARSGEKNLFWRNKELHAYIRGIEFQTDTARQAMQDVRLMRHDMRHKDQLLIGLLREGKYSEAEQMLHADIERLEQPWQDSYCDNVILNSILCSMAQNAELAGIRLSVLCTVPKEQNINDYDLAIVTSNLIENAIQAVRGLDEKDRHIELAMKNRNGESFFLEIKNPCHETVRFSGKTGLPVSQQGDGHGYGMMSVQEFARKYNAHFDCFVEEQTFIVRILIYFRAEVP